MVKANGDTDQLTYKGDVALRQRHPERNYYTYQITTVLILLK